MNWKFWQRKPKTVDVFGPVAKWSTGGLVTQQDETTPPVPAALPTVADPFPTEPAWNGPDQMNPEIKARWVEALRSGKYKQGTGRLKYRKPHQRTQYCCLGVLCELAVADGVIEPGEPMALTQPTPYRFAGAGAVLPDQVVKWAGLSYYNPQVKGEDGNITSLAELNDTLRLGFEEIADVIEKQL